jgi:RNA polymerase sigma-70 factor (ECF subfamily)
MRPEEEDRQLLEGLQAGRVAAFSAFLDRDYPVTSLVAGFVAPPDTADATVERTWRSVIGRIDGFEGPGGLRASVLALLLGELDSAGVLDRDEGVAPSEPGRFLEAGDRWEGWWSDSVASWEGYGDAIEVPAEARDVVVEAIQSLPMVQRVLILLRDAAGLSLEECEPILGHSREGQETLLHWARSSVRMALEEYLEGPSDRADAS